MNELSPEVWPSRGRPPSIAAQARARILVVSPDIGNVIAISGSDLTSSAGARSYVYSGELAMGTPYLRDDLSLKRKKALSTPMKVPRGLLFFGANAPLVLHYTFGGV